MALETSMHQQFLHRLSSVLDAHLGEEHFGVRELAKEVGLSKSQLLRKLRSLKGKSTSQFIREYRLRKANELLRQQAGTASEIAYRVGFSSPTYFSTCFHEYFGYPPGEAKLRSNGNTDEVSDNKFEPRPSRTHSKKRLILLFTLGVVLLVATSFALYLGIKNGIPEVEQNLPAVTEGEKAEVEKSIGVLPFVNLSGKPEFDYISEGMTGAITDKLTRIESFKKVVPFTTMATFKETDKSIQEIASELGVTHLLEGNLQKAGDTVKIVLRLIDGQANSYDWSEEFISAWEIDEVFQMQASVAENITSKMNAKVTAQESASIRELPTTDGEAYKLYLKAESQKHKYNKVGFDNAEQLYLNAIQIDSSYVDPYVGLSHMWLQRGLWGFCKEKEAHANTLRYLEKVMELDPDHPWTNFYYIMLFWYNWDFDTIESLFHKSKQDGTPYKSHVIDYARKTNRAEIALQLLEKIVPDIPNDPWYHSEMALLLWQNGKYVQCEKALTEKADLFYDSPYYNASAARIYIWMGNYEKARTHVEKIEINSKIAQITAYYYLSAIVESKSGSQEVADNYISELFKFYEAELTGSPGWSIALYYSAMGSHEKTIEWLQKSFDHHEFEMTWLYAEPLLEPIRKDPRYLELLHKVGFSRVIPL